MTRFKRDIQDILPDLVALRHDLHMHPELGYEEHRTSARIVEELEKIPGLSLRTGMAETGIVATLNADKPGRCLALRADIDALPIHEGNTFEHHSRTPGRMHACGHDGHTVCLIGTAKVLARHAEQLPGAVKFIFQPAEESGAGGQRMIADGALLEPTVDAAFALHSWPDAPLGSIVVGSGPILAAADAFVIELSGKGTHAAYPHNGTDVILTASHIVTALQAIVARTTNPIEPVVVSIGAIHAGEAHNVLPDRCRMLGTARTLNPLTRAGVKDAIWRTVESIAMAFGVRAEVRYTESYPPLINDARAARIVADVGRELLGSDNVNINPPPTLGGEDFAFYADVIPVAMWRLGLRPLDRDDYPKLHHPHFDFCDEAIPIAVHLHCHVAQQFLERGLE